MEKRNHAVNGLNLISTIDYLLKRGSVMDRFKKISDLGGGEDGSALEALSDE